MRSNALYFPYIALPDDAWTVKSLLYWDKLSSIVPWDHLECPEQTSAFMRALLTEGLVQPVVPAWHLHRIERFEENFIALIEHRLRRSHLPIDELPDMHGTTRIHVEKLQDIQRFLVDARLARRVDRIWYDVETTTANLFMAYLAACLGAIPEVDATPVTNNAVFAAGMRSPRLARTVADPVHRYKSREVVLRHLLPAPAGPVELSKLLHFKQQYGYLLPPLRASVEAHCTRVALLPDADDRIEANEAFLRECRQQISEIEEAMRPAFGKVVFSSLVPLFGAGFTAHAADAGNAIAYAGAALTLAGAAYQAIDSIRAPRAIKDRPLAYIAHARQVFAPA